MWQPYVPDPLKEVAQQLERGERPTATVRTLLSWFWGSQRRGAWIVTVIRTALRKLALETTPDFNSTYLDGLIEFIPEKPKPNESQKSVQSQDQSTATEVHSVREQGPRSLDPTYRVGRLSLANNPPVSVLPNDTVRKATTIMLRRKFSQLPVIDENKEVLGIFGWKSLGSRQALGQTCELVREAIDRAFQVTGDMPLLGVIELIEEHDCVLLRADSGNISSIITHYDISVTFAELSEPFLVLREIENHMRGFISQEFTDEEVVAALNVKRASRQSGVVHSLTFGDYLRFLDDTDRWAKLGIRVDLELFRKEVDEVREIRNEVMHFDPDPVKGDDLEKLRGFADFLGRIRSLKIACQRGNE
jgi:CBS domain-containing protein